MQEINKAIQSFSLGLGSYYYRLIISCLQIVLQILI